MIAKKILILICLLSAIDVHAGSKAPSTTQPAPKHDVPSETQKNIPDSDPFTSPASVDSKAVSTPPGHEIQSPTTLPSSHEMTDSYEGAFIRMLVTLLGLIFLVFATFWVLRRLGKGKFKMGGGHLINIIERKAVSPKTMLYVVQIGNKKVLISESQLEVRALSSHEESPDIEEESRFS